MGRADSFARFVLDQLRLLGDVDCRSMFGGHGLYHGGVFFGIIFKGRLYFKISAKTQPDYVERGMKPFCPSGSPRKTVHGTRRAPQVLSSYYEVPIDIVEEDERLADWAREAVRAQRQQKATRHHLPNRS